MKSGSLNFLETVQTGPGPHPACCTMGTGSFPGVKSGRGVTLTPHTLLVPWLRKSTAIPLLSLRAVRPVQSLSACTRVHFKRRTTVFSVGPLCPLVQGVPLPTKPGSSLIILLQTHSDTYRHNFTTDTFLFISHKTNVLLFKSRYNIFIGFGIIKKLLGLVDGGTPYSIVIHYIDEAVNPLTPKK